MAVISSAGIEMRQIDGRVIWRVPVNEYLPKELVATDDSIIVVESEAYALDRHDGHKKWTTKLSGNASLAAPVIHNGHVFLGTQNNLIYCLDADTGQVDWKKDISANQVNPGIVRGLVVDESELLVATEQWGDTIGTLISGRLYRFSLENGRQSWVYDTKSEWAPSNRSGMSSTPVVSNGVVYVSDALEAHFAQYPSTPERVYGGQA